MLSSIWNNRYSLNILQQNAISGVSLIWKSRADAEAKLKEFIEKKPGRLLFIEPSLMLCRGVVSLTKTLFSAAIIGKMNLAKELTASLMIVIGTRNIVVTLFLSNN